MIGSLMKQFFLLSVLLISTSHAANLSTTSPIIYVNAKTSADLKNVITGGLAPYSFRMNAGSACTVTTAGYFTALTTTGSCVVTVTDSSNPANSLPFTVTMAPISLSASTIYVTDGESKNISVNGGVYNFNATSAAGSITQPSRTTVTYRAPTPAVSDTITVTDQVPTSKTVKVYPKLALRSAETQVVRANTSFRFKNNLIGGVSDFTCTLQNLSGTCTNEIFTAGGAPGAGKLIIRDSVGQSLEMNVSIPEMSLQASSVIAAKGEIKYIDIYGGVSPFRMSVTNAVADGTKIKYTAPATNFNTQNFTITDTSGKALSVAVTQKLTVPATATIAPGGSYQIRPEGGVSSTGYRYALVSGSGTVSTSGLFSTSAVGTHRVEVRDSGSQVATISITTSSPPTISSFSPSTQVIVQDEKVILRWTQTGATSLILNPGSINVTNLREYQVTPSSEGTTTYTLRATNASGSVQRSTQVRVGKILPGDWIKEAYAPGCQPKTDYNDFIDQDSWRLRRVEPKDCAIVKMATPVFIWSKPMDKDLAGATTIKPMWLVIEKSGMTPIIVKNLLSSRHVLEQPLSAGMYTWYIQYTNVSGNHATTRPRRFYIPSSGLYSIPTADTIVSDVMNKPRPRTLPKDASFATIKELASTNHYRHGFLQFMADADTYVTAAYDAVPALPDSPTADQESKIKVFFKKEKHIIEVLSYAYYFTRPTNVQKANEYANKAMDRIMRLASLPLTGSTSEAKQDQVNREIYLTLALGLDLFQEPLGATSRTKIVTALKARLEQVYPRILSMDREPYLGHVITAAFYVVESLMYAAGTPEYPEADDDLKKFWPFFITSAGVWAGHSDGGYGNSTAYAWLATGTYAHALAAIKLITDRDLTSIPAFGMSGLNQLASHPAYAGHPNKFRMRNQFGDDLEGDNYYEQYTYDDFRLYASVTRKPEYEWYWSHFFKNLQYTSAHNVKHYLLLGAYPQRPVASNAGLKQTYLFEDAGYVAMHSDAIDTFRSSVFFRSSRLGSENHSHADNNAFTFISKGKPLLISSGYYDGFGYEHHKLVTRATRFKNALTFDGGLGQAEPVYEPQANLPGAPVYSSDFRGQLVNHLDNGTWVISTGDATLAYRGQDKDTKEINPLLNEAVRTIAYNKKEGIVIIYDTASSATNRHWELNFHSLFGILDRTPNSFKLVNSTVFDSTNPKDVSASACVKIHAPAGNVTTNDIFPVLPKDKAFTNQFHTRFRVTNSSKQFVSVTVLTESCTGKVVTVTPVENSINRIVKFNGKSLSFNGRRVQIVE